MGPIIGRIERELVAVAGRMKTATGLESNAALLDTLVAQAAELEAALRRHRWNVTTAAAELGIVRATVYRQMKRFGIVPPNQL